MLREEVVCKAKGVEDALVTFGVVVVHINDRGGGVSGLEYI